MHRRLPAQYAYRVFQRPSSLPMSRLMGEGCNIRGCEDARVVHEGVIARSRRGQGG
jgi:hypothetical protein